MNPPLIECGQHQIVGQHTEDRCRHQDLFTVAGAVGDKDPDIEQIEGADRLPGEKDGQTDGTDIDHESDVGPNSHHRSKIDTDQGHHEKKQIAAEQQVE